MQTTPSNKSRLVALLLCVFIGILGVHRMYAGKWGTAFLQILLTISFVLTPFVFFWVLIDFIVILIGAFTDAEHKKISRWITEQ